MYPGVPPDAETLAVPSLPPKQVTGVALQVATIGGMPVMVDEQVAVQPFASVTVTV